MRETVTTVTPATTGTIEATDVQLRYGTSWGAIWAGFFVAIVVEIMWTTLGVGVGAGSIHAAGAAPSAVSLGIWSAAWFFVETFIALFVGGWVAGKLAGRFSATQNGLHGLAVWGVVWLVLGYLLTTGVGSAFFSAADFLRGAFSNAAYAGSGASIAVTPTMAHVATQSASYVGYLLFLTLIVSAITAIFGARMATRQTY